MAATNKAGKAAQRPPLTGRVVRFLREVRSELRKVAWPNRRELVTYTMVVLGTVAVVALFLGLVDVIISEVLTLLGQLGR